MFVDDERDITDIVVRALTNRGFSITGFTDPILALREFQLNRGKYGIVISDIRMPGMDGYEFLVNVKRLNGNAKLLLITAFEIVESEHMEIRSAVEEVIVKPISINYLESVLHKHLKLNH